MPATTKHPNRTEVIKSKTIGHRTVMNTAWPRTCYLSRDYTAGKVSGYIVEIICNGINDKHHKFKTRRDAETHYDGYGPERD